MLLTLAWHGTGPSEISCETFQILLVSKIFRWEYLVIVSSFSPHFGRNKQVWIVYFPGFLKELYGEKRLKKLDDCYLKLCLLWPKIAIDKVLGPVQLQADRRPGENFADLMATTVGVMWIFHDNATFYCYSHLSCKAHQSYLTRFIFCQDNVTKRNDGLFLGGGGSHSL